MITCVKRGDEYHDSNYKELLMTDESDFADLPSVAPGSVAYTNDMAHTYMLGTDGVWREV